MNISMDKYKTAVLGKALKSVYRGEMTVDDSIELAKKEILAVFSPENKANADGFVGDTIGRCPLCGSDIVRTFLGYSCSGYKENGCRLVIRNVICSRTIANDEVNVLLEKGITNKLEGFVSQKTGKSFSACLKLEGDKVNFCFDN